MIPRLDRLGFPCVTEPRWIKTKADDMLEDCDALYITVGDKKYPIWKFMEMYCRIQDRKGHLIPFEMNTAQIKTYREMNDQYAQIGMIRMNEGKGRQMGSSTLICLLYTTLMCTRPGFRVAILADTQEKGRGLLNKYKFAYKNLPDALKQMLGNPTVDNSDKLEFDFGHGIRSSVEVIVANENAGASYTFQAIHESEVALWENIRATVTALEQTVADIDGTFIIRETTARGNNFWKSLYEAGKTRKSFFRSIFLGWFLDNTYEKPYDGHSLNQYERMLKDTLGLPLEKVQWWFYNYCALGEDLAMMKQEFPSTEKEMWQTTSISKFNSEIVEKRKEETDANWAFRGNFDFPKPVAETFDVNSPLTMSGYRMIDDDFGSITIFEKPIAGHAYALAIDAAEGGDDYYACQVFDTCTVKQVAVFHKTKIDEDQAAYNCFCLYDYYKHAKTEDGRNWENRVRVAGERNRGYLVLSVLARFGCDMVMDRAQDLTNSVKLAYGWQTNKTTRPQMIDSLAIMFRESNGNLINDYETLVEMENFQWTFDKQGNTKKLEATGGHHDDLVMSASGFCFCYQRGDFETIPEDVSLHKQLKIAISPMSKSPYQQEHGDYYIKWR